MVDRLFDLATKVALEYGGLRAEMLMAYEEALALVEDVAQVIKCAFISGDFDFALPLLSSSLSPKLPDTPLKFEEAVDKHVPLEDRPKALLTATSYLPGTVKSAVWAPKAKACVVRGEQAAAAHFFKQADQYEQALAILVDLRMWEEAQLVAGKNCPKRRLR